MNVRSFVARVSYSFVLAFTVTVGCKENEQHKPVVLKKYRSDQIQEMSKSVETMVTPQLAKGLTLKLWGVDSLVADPVSIDVDDQGTLYYTRTNRQKNSEFDIRGHQDWEIASIKLQTIDDKRAFLRSALAPANSEKNKWLPDLNGDGSHDWRDMTVQKEVVYSIKDVDSDNLADVSQVVIEDFHDEVTDAAGGILKHGDDLFVGIGPDLWKLNDEDADGVTEKKQSLSHGYGIHIGFSGHGMSGIEVGPEGKIYWQIGDIGFNGTGANGEKYEFPNCGVIVRANPDGSDFEVFSYGNRNTHEFVFDEYGNLISVDNDGDHPGESERLVYIVNGADLGWRINWQFGKYRDPDNNAYKVWMDEKLYVPHFEGQAAYITPPIANYVNGPTGMLYNPGTALGPEWKNTFFIGEFVGNPAQSGIHAFKLKQKGAGFELAETQKILGGVLATGIDFGPDGAMYLADWIDGWGTKNHGRIWKLDGSGANSLERAEVKTLLAEDLTKYNGNKLGELLRHTDMRIRQKAQFALASRGEDGFEIFKQFSDVKEGQLTRIHSIWGISQLARTDQGYAKALLPLLKDRDPEIKAQAAKWIGDVRFKNAGKELLPLLRDENSRVRFFAAEALGRISYQDAVQPLIQLLADNNDEDVYLRHAASLALARIGDSTVLSSLHSHQSDAVRMGAVIALRRMRHDAIQNFLGDKNENIVTEAARAINDDLSIEGALPALAEILNKTPFKNEPLIRRAINANLRLGSEAGLQNLLAYARSSSHPSAMRAEALAALSTWASPSVVDRVDGRYRGVFKRDANALKAAAGDALINFSGDKDQVVRLASVKAIGKLTIEKASTTLAQRVKSDPDGAVREEALKSLAELGDSKIGEAIRGALQDKAKNVRVVALDLLQNSKLPNDMMVSLLTNVIDTKTVEEKQAALIALGDIPLTHTQKSFEKFLAKHEARQFPVEASLELSDAIDKTGSEELKKRFKSINAKSSTDTLRASFAGALYGGDRDKGENIFYSHQTAQCIRCHSYGDYGGNAGPRLNGVAQRLTREQLLEALIDPSARLAPGYGMITLELKGGGKVSGILLEDKADLVKIRIGNKPDTVVQQSTVVKRTYAQSSMPPMRLLLTKKEIRDVVSFLSTLKE